MQQGFPALTSWDDYPRIGIDEFLGRFPDVAGREAAFEDEIDEPGNLRDWHEETQLIVICGDIAISDALLERLPHPNEVLLVVDGSVEFERSHRHLLYASGDLFCATVCQEDWRMQHPVGGRVVARLYALLHAEDDAFMVTPAAIRLDTPYVFSWYCRVDQLDLAPGTVVFLMDDGDDAASLDLPHPVFYRHDCVFALRPAMVIETTSCSANRFDWEIAPIDAALTRAKSIFIDGFTLACMAPMRAADAALEARSWAPAFAGYRAAARLSPAYYLAWLGMGRALFAAGAHAQAIPFFRKASTLFPAKQRGLRNDAANHAAISALVCRQPDAARGFATLSIDHLRERGYDSKLLGQAFGLRAEAYLIAGELEAGRADLARRERYQPDLASTHWLLGLYHYKRGEMDEALASHRQAVAKEATFSPFYDDADSLNFLYKTPVFVDWEGVTPPAPPP